jgi:hypothetical protein
VLLGDEPALEPEERFYQRLLAGDGTEAADMAEQGLRDRTLSATMMPCRCGPWALRKAMLPRES